MSQSPVVWFAVRSFFSRKSKKKAGRPLFGAVIGIALSLVPLTVVFHLSEGMIRGITSRYIETSTWHLQAYTYFNTNRGELEQIASDLGELEGIQSVIMERQGFALAYADDGDMGVTIRGLPEDLYLQDPAFREYITLLDGNFSLSEKGDLVLGSYAAEHLGVSVGDEVRVLTGRTFGSGRFVPKLSRFIVRGIITTGYEELDRMWAIVSLDDAFRILSDDDAHTLVGLKTSDPMSRPAQYVPSMVKILPPGWYAYSWKDLNGSQQKNFQTTQSILIMIMVILVIVAGVNIASSLIMLVLERQQEIGILKCTGSSPKDINRIFLFIGILAGTVGTVIGLTTGTMLSLLMNQILGGLEWLVNIIWKIGSTALAPITGMEPKHIKLINTAYYLEQIPVRFQALKVLVTGLFSILLSVVASVYPAHRAARVKPLDVIRKH